MCDHREFKNSEQNISLFNYQNVIASALRHHQVSLLYITPARYAIPNYNTAMADDILQECLRKTRHFRVQWKHLGLLLCMKKHRLDEIEKNNPRDVVTCMTEMLHAWITSNPENPKAMLDEALEEIRTATYDTKSKRRFA